MTIPSKKVSFQFPSFLELSLYHEKPVTIPSRTAAIPSRIISHQDYSIDEKRVVGLLPKDDTSPLSYYVEFRFTEMAGKGGFFAHVQQRLPGNQGLAKTRKVFEERIFYIVDKNLIEHNALKPPKQAVSVGSETLDRQIVIQGLSDRTITIADIWIDQNYYKTLDEQERTSKGSRTNGSYIVIAPPHVRKTSPEISQKPSSAELIRPASYAYQEPTLHQEIPSSPELLANSENVPSDMEIAPADDRKDSSQILQKSPSLELLPSGSFGTPTAYQEISSL